MNKEISELERIISEHAEPIPKSNFDALEYGEAEEMALSAGLKALELDVDEKCQEPEYLFSDNKDDLKERVKTFPKGNLQVVLAPKKSGKSTLGAVIMSSILGCNKFGLLSLVSNSKVLFCDTEQDRYDGLKTVNYIKELCGFSNDQLKSRFHALHLRGETVADKIKYTEFAIRLYKPDFVYLDGIVDYGNDINVYSDSQILVEKFLKMSEKYNCGICGVIHENKGDKNARGHLGSIWENKCSDGFQIDKEKKVSYNNEQTYLFVVTHYLSRHREIEPICFVRDYHKGGLPVPFNMVVNNDTPKSPKQEQIVIIANAVADILANAENHEMKAEPIKKAIANKTHIPYKTVESYMKDVQQYMIHQLKYIRKGKNYIYQMNDFSGYNVSCISQSIDDDPLQKIREEQERNEEDQIPY